MGASAKRQATVTLIDQKEVRMPFHVKQSSQSTCLTWNTQFADSLSTVKITQLVSRETGRKRSLESGKRIFIRKVILRFPLSPFRFSQPIQAD